MIDAATSTASSLYSARVTVAASPSAIVRVAFGVMDGLSVVNATVRAVGAVTGEMVAPAAPTPFKMPAERMAASMLFTVAHISTIAATVFAALILSPSEMRMAESGVMLGLSVVNVIDRLAIAPS